jgi:hypothetical protein
VLFVSIAMATRCRRLPRKPSRYFSLLLFSGKLTIDSLVKWCAIALIFVLNTCVRKLVRNSVVRNPTESEGNQRVKNFDCSNMDRPTLHDCEAFESGKVRGQPSM